MCGFYVFFEKCKRKLATRHSIEVESLEIRHRFCEEVFLFPFSEKSSLINDTKFYECIGIFCWELFLWKCILILHISSSFLIWHIEPRLLIFISSIRNSRLLFPLWELSSGSLLFYDTGFETVTISHFLFSIMERGTGFEPIHPRVEALVHSLFYVTPACVWCGSIVWNESKKSMPTLLF